MGLHSVQEGLQSRWKTGGLAADQAEGDLAAGLVGEDPVVGLVVGRVEEDRVVVRMAGDLND